MRKIKNPFKRRPKQITKESGEKTVSLKYAFTCGGRYFYELPVEEMNINRYQEFMVKLQEFMMGVNHEYLDHMNQEVLKELENVGQKFNLKKIIEFHDELRVRLAIAPIEEHVYSFLSALFVYKDEPLDTYDFQLNKEKIKFWRSQGEPPDFFSEKPVSELIGLQGKSIKDIEESFKNQNMILLTTLLKLGKELPESYNALKTSISQSQPTDAQGEKKSRQKPKG